MATRRVYEADIQFNINPDLVKKQLSSIEKSIESAVASFDSALSGISFSGLASKVGSQGGLGDFLVKDLRLLRANITSELEGLDEVTAQGVEASIRKVADRMGTTVDKILVAMSRLNDEGGAAFKAFTLGNEKDAQRLYDVLVGNSIFPQLVKDILVEFRKLEDQTGDHVDDIIVQFEKLFTEWQKGVKPSSAAEFELELGFVEVLRRLQTENTLQKIDRGFVDMAQSAKNALTTIEVGVRLAFDEAVERSRRMKDAIVDGVTVAARAVKTFAVDAKEQIRLTSYNIGSDIRNAFRVLGNELKADSDLPLGQIIATKFAAATQAVAHYKDVAVEAFRKVDQTFQMSGLSSDQLLLDGFVKATDRVRAFGNATLDLSRAVINRVLIPSINGTKSALSGLKNSFSNAFGSFKQEADLTQIPVQTLRQQIAQIEELVSRMPAKFKANFKELSRSFSETANYALSLERAIKRADEAGKDSSQLKIKLAEARNELSRLETDLNKFKTDQLELATKRFNDVGEVAARELKKAKNELGGFRDAITLASETGANKLLALRIGLFGLAEPPRILSGIFNRFGKNLDDVGRAEDKLGLLSVKTAQNMASMTSTIKRQVDELKVHAFASGVNAERLNDLDSQVNRVENAFKDMTTTIENGGRPTRQQLARIREESRLLDQQFAELRSQEALSPEALRQLDILQKRLKATTPATRVLAATMNDAADKVEKAKEKIAKTNKEAESGRSIFSRLADALRGLFGSSKQAEQAMDRLGDSIERSSEKASLLKNVFAGFLAGGIAGGIVGNIDGITSSIGRLTGGISAQVTNATLKIRGAFDLTEQQAVAISDTIRGAWANNFGNSIEDVANTTQIVVARLSRLGITSQEVIQQTVEDAHRLRDAYNIDVQDSLDAAQVLMKNFGLTSRQATDFIANLSQKGVIGPDVLDSITEYSVQIRDAGGSAETLFNLLETGFQGAGTLGTDRAIDLFKEFRVRIQDGSDTTSNGLKQIGINSADLLSKLSSGLITSSQAFEFVLAKLKEIDDENLRMQAGVALMGTQFEDLGQTATFALSTTGTGLEDMVGSVEKIDIAYTSFGAQAQAISRQIKLALDPISSSLLSLGNAVIPYINQAFLAMTPVIQRVSDSIQYVVDLLVSGQWQDAGDFVLDVIANMVENIASYMESLAVRGFDYGASFIIELYNGLITYADQLITEAANYIASIINSFLPQSDAEQGPLSNISQFGKGLASTLEASVKAADFSFMQEALSPIQDFFKQEFGGAGFKLFEGVREQFLNIVDELNRTGNINVDAFDQIAETIGDSNTELTKMLKLQLQLKKAQRDLEKIQEQVAAAERSGFVPKELRDKLATAEKQVDQAKENVEWQKEFLKFNALNEKSFAGVAKAAGAAGAAGAKGAATAKDAMARYFEFINEGYTEERRILDAKLDAGVISYEEWIRSVLNLNEKYVDAATRTNSAIPRSLIEETEVLTKRLEDLREKAKASGKKALAEGSSIITDFLGLPSPAELPKVSNDLVAAYSGIGERITVALTGGVESTARQRITSAWQIIRDNFLSGLRNLFNTIRQFLLENVDSRTLGIWAIVVGAVANVAASPFVNAIKSIFGPIANAIAGSGGLGRILKVVTKFGLKFGLVGAVIVGVIRNWDDVVRISMEIWEALEVGFGAVIKTITELYQKFSQNEDFLQGMSLIFGSFGTFFTVILQFFGILKKVPLLISTYLLIPIGNFVNTFLNSMIEAAGGMDNFVSGVSGFVLSVGQLLSELATTAYYLMGEILAGNFDGAISLLKAKLPTLGEVLGEIGGQIASGLKIVGQALLDALNIDISGPDLSGFNKLLADLKQGFEDFMQEGRLGGELANLFGIIRENIAATAVVLSPFIPLIVQFGSKSSTLAPVYSKFLPVLGRFSTVLGKIAPIVGLVLGAFERLDIVLPAAEQTLVGIVRAIGGVIEAISGMFKLFSEDTRAEGINQIFTGWLNLIDGLIVAFLNLADIAAAAVFGMAAQILDALGSIAEQFGAGEEIVAIFDNAALAARNLVTRFNEAKTQAIAIWRGLVTNISFIFEALADKPHELLTVMIEAVVSIFREITTRSILWATSLYNRLFGNSIFPDMVEAAKATMQRLIDEALPILGAWIDDIIAKAGELSGQFLELIRNWIEDGINYVADNYQQWAEDLAGYIGTLLTSAVDAAKALIASGVASLLEIFTQWFDDTFGSLDEEKDNLGYRLGFIVGSVIESALTFFTETIPGQIEKFVTGITNIFTGGIAEWENGAPDAATRLGETVGIVVGGIFILFTEQLPAWITQIGENALELVSGMALSVIENRDEIAANIWDAIKGAIHEFFALFDDGLPGLIENLGSLFGKLFTGAVEAAKSKIPDPLKGLLGLEDTEAVATDAANKLEGALSGVGESIAAPAEEGTNKVVGFFKGMSDAIWGNSIVPDMLTGINNMFNTLFVPSVQQSLLLVQNGFTQSSAQMVATTSSTLNVIVQIWTQSMRRILDTARRTLDEISAMLERIRQAILRIVSAVEELIEIMESLGETKGVIENLTEAYEDFETQLKKVNVQAKQLIDYMRELQTIQAPAIPGAGGSTTSAFRFAPAPTTATEIASRFSGQVPTQQTSQPQETGGRQQFFYLNAEFPNVSSAESADEILDSLNSLMQQASRRASLGVA